MNDKQHVFVKYGYRSSCGLLATSLSTRNYISSESFEKMIRTGNYYLKGFDSKCNEVIWFHKSGSTILFIEFDYYE